MQKMKMEPGRKYRGTAWVNEYGEIQFRPEQKGTKPKNLKLVLESDSFSIYESAHIWKVSVKFDKPLNAHQAARQMSFVLSQVISHI